MVGYAVPKSHPPQVIHPQVDQLQLLPAYCTLLCPVQFYPCCWILNLLSIGTPKLYEVSSLHCFGHKFWVNWRLHTASIQLNLIDSDIVHCPSTLVCINPFVHSTSFYEGFLLALSSIVSQIATLITSYVLYRVSFDQPLFLVFISSMCWIILSFRMSACYFHSK